MRTFDFQKNGNESLFPVIVLLHPGTFMYDFPFDGRKFAANLCCENFIIVVVNYRLGPLGFLGTGNTDTGIKLNLGMLDQVTALKWIQRNIHSFYGDPKNVTLVGVAAGAASVHLHLMSRWSKGLFKQAVSFSGSALVPWATAKGVYEKTVRFSNLLHCNEGDSATTAECMRNQDLNNLKDSLNHLNSPLFYGFQNTPLSPLGPVVDHDFLDDDPWILLRAGAVSRVPYLMSFTDSAGLLPTAHFSGKPITEDKIDNEWGSLAPSILDYKDRIDWRMYSKFANRTRDFYFNIPSLPSGELEVKKGTEGRLQFSNNFHILLKMVTDRLYTSGIVEAARLQGHVEGHVPPVFLYRFSFQGEFSFSDQLFHGERQIWGPAVGDDFMTYIANQYPLRHGREKDLVTKMKKVFTSFVTRGNYVELMSDWVENKTEGMLDTNNIYTIGGNPKYALGVPNSRPARIVTYNHIVDHKTFKLKRSNNIGCGKFWRRAPVLHPNIFNISYY